MTGHMDDFQSLAHARENWRYHPPVDLLAGRVILVTGAGDGIGAVAAKTFALYGASVVLLGRTRQTLEAQFDWITEHTQTQPVIVPADLAVIDESSASALYDAIQDTYGRLDGILHNASVLGPKVPIEQYPWQDWRAAFDVNVHAPFLLTKTLLPLLQQAPLAALVLTSSSVGRQGRAYWGAYSASKFALEGLTQILADELENVSNIRVNSVNPGGTRTKMRQEAYPAENPDSVPTPEAHMDLYLYLMGNAGTNVTGQQFDCRNWQPDAVAQ